MKKNRKQFLEDLERGLIEERKVYQHFKKRFPNTKHFDGYKKEYDILVNNKCGIEVKFDERSKTTGNYFIETYFEGSPSGITSTEAKLWVISNGIDYLFINTKDIKKVILEFDLRESQLVIQGNQVKFYLIPKKLLDRHGKFIQLG